MGLDNYWIKPDTADAPVLELDFDPPLRLCGGMFSSHGSGSFRGKVYCDFVENVTGISLYEDMIPNETVRKMADDLEAFARDTEKPAAYPWLPDLIRMFRAYADAGAALTAWY